jgi:hypothetical protein
MSQVKAARTGRGPPVCLGAIQISLQLMKRWRGSITDAARAPSRLPRTTKRHRE